MRDTNVVIVDCQTTGMAPDKAHLLEIGWVKYPPAASQDDSIEITSILLSLPEGEEIPPRISGMTGITDEMLLDGLEPEEVAQKLQAVSDNRVFVAHFAQFEKRWIAYLFNEYCPQSEIPDFICTREIVKRLHPDLPGGGIRAVAGYYGHTIPEKLRAGSHVKATIHIWRKVVRELSDKGIDNLTELNEYLDSPVSAHEGSFDFPMDRDKRLSLPDIPGIYKMLSLDGTVLYVGKAKSLRSRVNSYFTKRSGNRKKLELAAQVYDVCYVEYDTPLEAALAEYDAIQKFDPQYNSALRNPGKIVYFTEDFTDCSGDCGGKYPVGPIQSGTAVENLPLLLESLVTGDIPSPESIGMDYLPLEQDAPEDGFRMFMQQYFPHSAPTLARLLKIGKDIHRSLKTEKQKDTADDSDELHETKLVITAEAVFKHIEWLVAEASRLIRLSRWIILLSRSYVVWYSSDDEKKILEIGSGKIVSCSGTSMSEEHEHWSGEVFSGDAAVRELDSIKCGRLRVLTSELRRLVRSGRKVEITHRMTGGRLSGSRLLSILEDV